MRKFLIGCLFASLAAACGGGDDSISFPDFPDELINAQCDNGVQCGSFPDDASCQAASDIDPGQVQTIQNAIDDGTIIFHEDAAAACVDFQASQDCDFPGFHSDVDNPCADIFEGTVAVGGACDIDIECADQGLCNPTDPNCDPNTACCPGTCEAGQPINENVAIGGTCNDTSECVSTAYCKVPQGADTGTCTAVITQDGAACDPDSFFDSCANPMICDIFAASPICETPQPTGAACVDSDLLPCIDSRDICEAGTCAPAHEPGEPCPMGNECIGYATCVNADHPPEPPESVRGW